MKILATLAVIWLVCMASPVQAQQTSGYVEEENILRGSANEPWVNVYAKGALREKVGWTVWAQTSKGWSEALAGLTFAPTSFLEVSAIAGIETDEKPFRYSGTAWLGKGRFSFLTIQETGGSGYWQKNMGVFQIKKPIAVGVYQQTFVGTGPYAEIKFGSRFSVWGTRAVDSSAGIITARFSF